MKINVDLIYPIGSIYMSTLAVNPETLFGGKWERTLIGQVPVGCDATASNLGQRIGNATHTHTNGVFFGQNNGKYYLGISNNTGNAKVEDLYGRRFYGCDITAQGYTLLADNVYGYNTLTGSSYQPSEIVAFWKRTA